MTGLDKILQVIEQDAEQACKEIRQKAEREAQEVRAAGQAEADAILQEQKRLDEAESALISARMQSAAKLQNRQRELAQRRACIDEVLVCALGYIAGLPDKEYFDALKKMLLLRARPEEGILQLNRRDLARMEPGFLPELCAALPGGTLTLDTQPAEIDGGFVLRYGDVEENCSFEAILSADRDRLSDMVNEILFAQE